MTYPLIQTYTYDSLNRLDDANETSNGTQTWRQDFTFDRYGNRNFNQTNTTMPASFANPAVTNPTASTTNNRLTSTGYLYDNAGNTTRDAAYQTFTYDGENKQTEVKNSSSVSLGQYWYDGDGKRIKKYVPASGETTIFVYDASGKQIAEYSTIVEGSSTAKVNYLTNDHLGSPRINTDQNGAIISRHDYHPFGEEIDGTGGRTTGLNYGDDSVRKQFTSYERDTETDLDFAQARMFSYSLGRFTSPDDFLNDTNPLRPQSWNLYTYVRNNPLRLVDPNGEKAKVTIERDKKTKTGTIKIEASFVVYGANGQGVTEYELNEQKDLIKQQIEATYSGQFKGKDGITYDISADITVEVAGSEKDAKKAVADDVAGNIVEVGNKEISDINGKKGIAYASSFRHGKETFDRVMVSLNDKYVINEGNTYAHEFTHLLGYNDHSKNEADVSGLARITPSALTESDKTVLFAPQIKQLRKETTRRGVIVPNNYRRWKK